MSESMCACLLGDPLQVVFPVTLPVGIVLLRVVAGDGMAITEFIGGMGGCTNVHASVNGEVVLV